MRVRLKRFAVLFPFLLVFVAVVFRFLFITPYAVEAESQEEKLARITSEIETYEKEIEKLNSQASTLSNQIAQYNAQISLTAAQISQTEEKISLLGGRISQLEGSLESLGNAFSSRVEQTYTMARLNDPTLLLILSPDLSRAVSSYHYLKRIQEADRSLLVRLEDAQLTYKTEKVDQEVLQSELEEQKAVLGVQKSAKANLLQVTRNDEKKYQSLLAAARSEFEAIQAIIAGKGDEEEAGKVSQGQRIATVIQGASCNSSGAHVHFIVTNGDTTQNPFNHLRGGVDYENCSGSSCGSTDGDAFAPSGSWDWPVNPKIHYSQGYGSTWAIRNTWVGRIYSFHNGIDIDSESSSEVKAVQAGTLYRGSYGGGGGGCRLRYVRVDHDDSDLETYYLHINY